MKIVPVILCGGAGSRMWPLSRESYPKQFLNLYGDQTLLQQTVTRLSRIDQIAAPILIANNEQRFIVAEQLRMADISDASIVLEPTGRNTAPAVALASFVAIDKDPDAILVILPSDHVIINNALFQDLVLDAVEIALQGKLVTFGIVPTDANTGYGYILKGETLHEDNKIHRVASFVEKPNFEKATEYYASGDYYWNSGMFVFSARTYLNELGKWQPKILENVRHALELGAKSYDFIRVDSEAFASCPSLSIDYAVMEHTEHATVIAANGLGWSDIGSWNALAEITPADEYGNNILGDVITEDVKSSYLRSENRMLAVLGVENLIVIETADAVLVAHKDNAQDVKKIVEKLRLYGRTESVMHRKVYRPWGSYEALDSGGRFQVKRIIVNPGSSLSLQMHYHRAEHWIVVSGTARVVNGESTILLSENQSTYIPIGTKHRLDNPGKLPLELIEVQSGGYLGEDDIVRFEDVYGRVTC